ncbi:MAG: hypothetical protein LBH02_01140 [Methanocalculaceae archaeon]|jgi:hypothetical protein|nr:hypothetical protein [Methanocalculaceae archaeon]
MHILGIECDIPTTPVSTMFTVVVAEYCIVMVRRVYENEMVNMRDTSTAVFGRYFQNRRENLVFHLCNKMVFLDLIVLNFLI